MTLALKADDGGTITNREGVGLSMALGIDGAGVYVLGVTYRRSRKKDDAIVLNVCPWCGNTLLFESKGEEMEKVMKTDDVLGMEPPMRP
jgi:hypothetical protein